MTAAGTAKVGPPTRRKAIKVHRIQTSKLQAVTESPRLTSELLRLLDTLLDTIEKVHVSWHLLDVKRPMLASELQANAHLDAETMRATLTDLVRARVVKLSEDPVPTVRLAARARRADFESVMKLYGEDRLVVVAALTSIAVRRIRTMTARRFAEAFALRKTKREPR